MDEWNVDILLAQLYENIPSKLYLPIVLQEQVWVLAIYSYY